MPELPEVDTVRASLAPAATGATVRSVRHDGSRKFAEAAELDGRRVERVLRRGKYLLADLDDDRQLIVHLGMSGVLTVTPGAAQPVTGTYRAQFELVHPHETAHGNAVSTVLLRDPRGFGRLAVRAIGDWSGMPGLSTLGPEPFSDAFTPLTLLAGLRRTTMPVHVALLNQRIVAGLGNIYAAEALHTARIRPDRPADTITRPEAVRLHAAIRQALQSGLDNGGTTLRDYRKADGTTGSNQDRLRVYGRAGQPCLRCHRDLVKLQLAGRTVVLCRSCQPARTTRKTG